MTINFLLEMTAVCWPVVVVLACLFQAWTLANAIDDHRYIKAANLNHGANLLGRQRILTHSVRLYNVLGTTIFGSALLFRQVLNISGRIVKGDQTGLLVGSLLVIHLMVTLVLFAYVGYRDQKVTRQIREMEP